MFRKGGDVEGGITSGLAPRQGYQGGKLAQVQQDLAILNQLAPAPEPRRSQAGSNFLLKVDTSNIGYNLESDDEIIAQGKFNS